jgi:integrase
MPFRENPLDKVTLNFVRNRRDRRLQDRELELIIRETKKRKNPIVLPVILWAIETGMRRGEILSMKWKDIDLRNRVVLIPQTKNGTPRKIPLTDRAKGILEGLDPTDDRVFPIAVENFKISWRRILDKIKIQGLTFHDLRHEAVSSLFERGLNTPEVASISGHKDWRILAIYTNPKPANILKKLNAGDPICVGN